MSRILLSALVAAAAIASLMAPGCDRASSSNKGETAKPAATTTPAAAPDEAAPDEAAPEAPAEPDGTAQPAAASSARERACPDLADPRYALDPHAVCTEMDCPDGFHLNVTNVPYNGPGWPHGTYTYTITADGEEVTCTGSLPLDCDVPTMQCSNDRVVVERVGCALPPDSQAFGGVHFAKDYPQSVRVVIARDGTTLFDQTFEPDYRIAQPNGTGCAPVCCQATATTTVPLEP